MAYARKTLEGWKTAFDSIYGRKNLALDQGDILLRVVEEAAEIVKPVLTMEQKEIRYGLPDILAWICAFANKCDLSLNEAMQKEYVGKPPGKEQTDIRMFQAIGKDTPESLGDWQQYLRYLYHADNRERGPVYVLTKLTEDVGEASRRLRMGSPSEKVLRKLCNALAWSIALANISEIDMEQAVWEKYPGVCTHCNQSSCACSSLSTVFISYTSDTDSYHEAAKRVISELLLSPRSFPDFGPSFERLRMVEMFDAIARSDGGLIILYKKYSANVYAELLEMLRAMDNKNVWIYVKNKTAEDRDAQLARLLEDLEHFRRLEWFDTQDQFINSLKGNISKRLKEIKTKL